MTKTACSTFYFHNSKQTSRSCLKCMKRSKTYNIHVSILLNTYTYMAGPKENTIKDFWYMVWQEKVEIIVMVTKLDEDGRV